MNDPIDANLAPPAADLRALIEAQAGMPLPPDDIVRLMLPLFAQVAALHADGKVAGLDADEIVLAAGVLALRRPQGLVPSLAPAAIARIQPHAASSLNIIGALERGRSGDDSLPETQDLALQSDAGAPIARPVYLPGPLSWERLLGHHDELTDVFALGMTLAALATGLDFAMEDDLRQFVTQRRNLFALNPRLHPILAALVVEMTEVNRHERATGVAALATRLRTWRDQPLALDVGRALAGTSGATGRRAAVLTHLRDRLFDLSRHNRLLHFRPTAATVNLTVASVPLVLQVDSIRADDICTWNGAFAADVVAGKPVSLQQWLRFDDQPYLPGALDQLLSDTRRDRAEFGFSNLRLVVAFLRWHNLKEDPDERIVTPLLWLPVELVKRKGVRDHYVLQCADADAEFNPVLRHQLSQLYDIRLPEKVDLETTSLAEIHAGLLAQIRRTEPAVELRLVDKPAIRLVRQKAMQRMQQYQRRKPAAAQRTANSALPPYSYARDDYRPLGQALFERWVRPSPLPQRFEAGAPPLAAPRQPQMAEGAEAREGYVLEESSGHRYAWDVDLTQVTLANFNYKKMSLVRDYAQLLDTPDANPAFDRVFSIEPRAVDTGSPAPLAQSERWNVVASDATQNAAVSLARSERSFIIQGPPGTGKSQTITNLIADYAGRGKRVLFVCEKRAALDVVFSRLRQSALDPLCCLIHDSQTDKKAFIADLKSCYEAWIAQPNDGQALAAQRAALVSELDAHQARINAFEAALAAAPDSLGTSVRALLRRVASLAAPPVASPAVRAALPELASWDAQRELAMRLHRAMRERFGLDSLAAHAFARLAPGLVTDDGAYARVEGLCRDTDALFEQLDPLFANEAGPIGTATPLAQARALAQEAARLMGAGLAAHLDLLDASSGARATLQATRTELAARTAALAEATAATAHWRDKLAPADTAAALALAQELEPSPLRWLQPRWWRLRGELQRRYDFGKHAVQPDYRQVLAALAAEQQAAGALDAAEADSRQRYGVDDMNAFLRALGELEARLQAGAGPQALVAWLRAAADPIAAAALLARAAPVIERLAGLTHDTLDLAPAAPLGEIAELLRDLREGLDDLPDLLPPLRAVHAGDPACAMALRRLDHSPEEFDALLADEALRRAERAAPVLQAFGGAALAQAARALAAGQRELLALNAQVVRASQHARFARNVAVSAASAAGLDDAAKAFKKRYAGGRRELEHEFGKSMRHRAIRELSSGDSGAVINDLKPVWLMSPLSVSDTLPLAADLFDVVIFDEASQIPVEESVPALSRARQVVVVGDEMQLPPTSFFASGSAGEIDEIEVEEEGERIAIHLDSDSLLSQAARNLPATLLAWHYRSRHEALISFSNAAFYEGRLVTIPDRAIEQAGEAAAPVRSDAPDVGAVAADSLVARPVSYHLVADGVYSERRNLPEAQYIARMVRELLRRETPHSLGIVAFSEAQQGAIEAALDALAAEDADFATRLEREYVREDDDGFNGLFVKNLENVQGDERDVIILSICYAPGPDGKMLMTFGPINGRGGEKRLNVIFSRARHRMAVVSTIAPEAITNTHNDGAAALRAFLQFAQASSAGQFERAQAVLGALNAGARDAFERQAGADSIRDALAQALRERGHDVHVNVGRSQFRCDLAIAAPSKGGYALALLLDNPGETVHDSAERYVFRPGILRSFGWRVLDLPGKDWLDDPEAVIARIEAMLASGEDTALGVEVAAVPLLPRAWVMEPAPVEVEAAAADTGTPDLERSLVFQAGSSHKFWRAALRGTELTVSYGRVGSAGQTLAKNFESSDRAAREMEKLVAEKLRKGYTELHQ
ncbi:MULTISPECIES: AAA domain-containing protein [unclassified Massilia]|uniref:AAA domain-containing protein n=1 Tax=unclassified Massilia TaxID=2609279 RepID=UPI0017834E32|nr:MULTISPECIES: AAA domain-containing protein [unclassified Massilia]MBD8528475.1 WGR domain-containing protein [Massilia sp. CFBP 13647]MBD8671902.1 WGR domain-containing protein [Massilia sp. CFBP 13721]